MGNEVRRVPADWEHPKDGMTGQYVPLYYANFGERAREWDEEKAKWERGEFPDYADEEHRTLSYEQWNGQRPCSKDYMPDWPASERTHYMMYEITSEGTPISPSFATPEELARWLADTSASAFAGQGASYEAWLRIARGGWAPSMVFSPQHGLQSGVSAALSINNE